MRKVTDFGKQGFYSLRGTRSSRLAAVLASKVYQSYGYTTKIRKVGDVFQVWTQRPDGVK